MSNYNFASIEAGARIVDFSSVVDNCDPSNVLDASNDMIWLSEKGLPQWLCISLEDIHVREDAIIRTVGWRCWHPYKTNPRVVKLHVSPDGSKFKEWDTFTAQNPRGLTQLFCCAPISLVLFQYIAFEILDTFGGDQTYINSLYLFSDEIAQSPLVSLGEVRSTPSSSVQGDVDLDTDDDKPKHVSRTASYGKSGISKDFIVNVGQQHRDDLSANGSVDTGALLSQLGLALGLDIALSDSDSEYEMQSQRSEETECKDGQADCAVAVPSGRDVLEDASDISSYQNAASVPTDSQSQVASYGRYPVDAAAIEKCLSLSHNEIRKSTESESSSQTSMQLLPSDPNPAGQKIESLRNSFSGVHDDASTSSRVSRVSSRLRRLEDQIGTLVDAFQSFQRSSDHSQRTNLQNTQKRYRGSVNNMQHHSQNESFGTISDEGSTYESSSDSDIATSASFQAEAKSRNDESDSIGNSLSNGQKEFTRRRENKEDKEEESESLVNSLEDSQQKDSNQYQYLLNVIGRIDALGSTSLCTELYEDSAIGSSLKIHTNYAKSKNGNENEDAQSHKATAKTHRDHRYHMSPATGAKEVVQNAESFEISYPSGTYSNDNSEVISAHVSDSLSIYENNDPIEFNEGHIGAKLVEIEEGSEFTSIGQASELADNKISLKEGHESFETYESRAAVTATTNAIAALDVAEKRFKETDGVSALNNHENVGTSSPKHSNSKDNDKNELFHRVENIEGLLHAVMLKLEENARNLVSATSTVSPSASSLKPLQSKSASAVAEITDSSTSAMPAPIMNDFDTRLHKDQAVDTSSLVWNDIHVMQTENKGSTAVRGHYEQLQSLHKPGLVSKPKQADSPPLNRNDRYVAPATATQMHLANTHLQSASRRQIGRKPMHNFERTNEQCRDGRRSVDHVGSYNDASSFDTDESESIVFDMKDDRFARIQRYASKAPVYHDSIELRDSHFEGRARMRHVDVGEIHLKEPKQSARRIMLAEAIPDRGAERASYVTYQRPRNSSTNHSTEHAGIGSLSNSTSTMSLGTDVEIADIVRRLHAKVLKRTLKEAELRAIRDGSTLQLHLRSKSHI